MTEWYFIDPDYDQPATMPRMRELPPQRCPKCGQPKQTAPSGKLVCLDCLAKFVMSENSWLRLPDRA